MILYHTDTGESVNVDDDFIIDNYLISRFNGRYDTHAMGLTIFIADQEEGLSCRYDSGDPDFFRLVDKVNERTNSELTA